MKLQMRSISPTVSVVTTQFNDEKPTTTVIDTANFMQPVPLDRWIADQGGTRPIEDKHVLLG